MTIQASFHTITFSVEVGLKLRNIHSTANHKARFVIYPLGYSDFSIWLLQIFLCPELFLRNIPIAALWSMCWDRAWLHHRLQSDILHNTLCNIKLWLVPLALGDGIGDDEVNL